MNQYRHLSSLDIDELVRRFDEPDIVRALILTGSYARDEAGPNSDIDLVRFVTTGIKSREDGTYLYEGKVLVNLYTVEPHDYEKWFTHPFEATKWIAGLRTARVLIERENFFTDELQVRARDFAWDSTMQALANVEVSHRLVGWCEEANKGLEGLRRHDDTGRLLNACFGLSWGLSEVIQIQRGILITSDNNAFLEVESALGDNIRMIKLLRVVYGTIAHYALRQRVIAGLQLFVLVAEQMSDIWQANDAPIIRYTVDKIRNFDSNLLSENLFDE